MRYSLSSVFSMTSARPTMLVPAFTCASSNHLYTHDLDTHGKVKAFLRLPEHGLQFCSNAVLPELTIEVGDEGVFVLDDGTDVIFVGNAGDLFHHFATNSYVGTLLEIEAAICVGDANRLTSGLSSLEWAENAGTAGSVSEWIELEESTFEAVQAVRDSGKSAPVANIDHEASFKSLTADPESAQWSRTWVKLWHANFRRKQLVKIACWREDAGYAPLADSGQVYYTIAKQSGGDDYVHRHCSGWLKRHSYLVRHWISVAISLLRQRALVYDVEQTVFGYLEADVKQARAIGMWVQLWLLAWSNFNSSRKNDLLRLAHINLDEHPKFSDVHGDMFLYLLRDKDRIDEFIYHIEPWLAAYKKNSVVWADLFAAAFFHRVTEGLVETGRSWTAGWGGTVTAWLDIWRSLRPHIDASEHLRIGIDWLARARWDLRIWPVVFNDCGLAARNTLLAERLIIVGQRWVDAGFGTPRTRDDIRKMMSYIS